MNAVRPTGPRKERVFMSRNSFAVRLVLVCFSAALLTRSAWAATFTVTNTSDSAAGCVVKRSYLGVAMNGVTAGGNDTGIRLDNGSAGATIGLPGEGNVLSGGNTGISEWFSPGPNTAPHTIQNNYVGLDASGT